MAARSLHVCRVVSTLSKHLTSRNFLRFQVPGCRQLYTQQALAVDEYINAREKFKLQFHGLEEKFRSRMRNILESEDKNLIFTEDLKSALHLAENTEDDIDLVYRMLKRFSEQDASTRFGLYSFGPVMMRMYHYLNQVDVALKVFFDPDMEHLCKEMKTFQILMDILYENQKYQEVLDIFEIIREKHVVGNRYPRAPVMLMLAACYKLNTPDSFEATKKLLHELQAVGHVLNRGASSFATGLALKQNSPAVALELIGTLLSHCQNYFTVVNMKVAALADVRRPEEAMHVVRNILDRDYMERRRPSILKEVVEKLKASVEELNDKEVTLEFRHICKALMDNNIISDETFDDILCRPIEKFDVQMFQRQSMAEAGFNRESRNRQFYSNKRQYPNERSRNSGGYHQRLGARDMKY